MAVNFFDQFNIQTDKPIDIRMTVATKADLFDAASYNNGLYAHKGMAVVVLADESAGGSPQLYMLTTNKSGYTSEVNWRRFSLGVNRIEDIDNIIITNPQPGDILVYNPNGTSGNVWENRGPAVETILPYSGTDAAGIIVIKTDGSQEFIVINELDNNVAFATETSAGIVEISTLNDIITGNDLGESGAIITTKPSDVRQFVLSNRDLVIPPPNIPTDFGEVGTWSYDDNYIYYCVPTGTSGATIWRRSTVEIW